MARKIKARNIKVVDDIGRKQRRNSAPEENSAPIAKPGAFNLDKFKSKRAPTIANVETLQSPLPVHNMAARQGFRAPASRRGELLVGRALFRERADQRPEAQHAAPHRRRHWRCRFLESGEILRFRLALATKPDDVFFLCEVPTQNLDNSWNNTNLEACEQAKTLWTKATSQKGEGVESYKITFARDPDAFPEPNWPTQSLGELIARAFAGRMIETEDHPALLRKIGAKQSLS